MSNGTCKIIKFQLTAARRRLGYPRGFQCHHDCFNSQPPEGGWQAACARVIRELMFQLTAARRRLDPSRQPSARSSLVSTHSRPKAAGCTQVLTSGHILCFNSQPPEGGW